MFNHKLVEYLKHFVADTAHAQAHGAVRMVRTNSGAKRQCSDVDSGRSYNTKAMATRRTVQSSNSISLSLLPPFWCFWRQKLAVASRALALSLIAPIFGAKSHLDTNGHGEFDRRIKAVAFFGAKSSHEHTLDYV